MCSVKAATWRLELPDSTSPESTEPPDDHSLESIYFNGDGRKRVEDTNFQNGGVYRSIVKIQSRFQDPVTKEFKWLMGSGWLIRDDVLVTAGHLVYNRTHNYCAVSQIKCYIGYNGAQSVPSQDLPFTYEGIAAQARYGSKVITPESWTTDEVAPRRHDVAFIQVHRPFTGDLSLFEYIDTPAMVTLPVELGVVGPGDQMYESFNETIYNLNDHRLHMISYTISTYGGQSGSPILRRIDNNNMAIGTHCYGSGDGETKNSGSSIGGKWGIDYRSFVSLFEHPHNFATIHNVIQTVTPSTGTTPINGPEGIVEGIVEGIAEGIGEGIVEKSFLSVLTSVARIGATVPQQGCPLLGPVGTLVGTVAGGLLGAIANQESINVLGDANAELSAGSFAPGVAERAVLAEASLQAVISLFNNCTSNDPIVNKVMAHMSHNYVLNAPNVDALSTRLASQLTECALDIASQRSNIAMMEPLHREGELQRQYPEAPINPSSAESGFNLENQDAFAKGLLEETHPFSGREEGAFNFLLPLLAKALSVSKPLVSPAATDLVNQLVSCIGRGSAEAAPSPLSTRNSQAVHLLFQRALVADTALMALLSLPDDELKKLNITLPVQQKSDQREESIFDFIKTAIQKIGPFTLETAQGAIMRFAPILVEMAVTAAVTESGASLAAGQQQLWNVARYRNALVAMSPDRNVNPVSNADGSGGVPVSAVVPKIFSI
ncbi:hypothetical protein B0H14DRAFT_2744005 [Mycena olivaceomarginata]|nr:hypothetical protein B0H14DRAFT_2744005 [Mycena olivaceomarginata]